MTPTWRNSSRSNRVEGVTQPPHVVKGKGLNIPLTPTRELVKEGVTYVP